MFYQHCNWNTMFINVLTNCSMDPKKSAMQYANRDPKIMPKCWLKTFVEHTLANVYVASLHWSATQRLYRVQRFFNHVFEHESIPNICNKRHFQMHFQLHFRVQLQLHAYRDPWKCPSVQITSSVHRKSGFPLNWRWLHFPFPDQPNKRSPKIRT